MPNDTEQTDNGKNDNRIYSRYICPYCGEKSNNLPQCIFADEAEECENYNELKNEN